MLDYFCSHPILATYFSMWPILLIVLPFGSGAGWWLQDYRKVNENTLNAPAFMVYSIVAIIWPLIALCWALYGLISLSYRAGRKTRREGSEDSIA